MRAMGMFSHFVLFLFLLLFLWIGVTYVSQNIQYSSAKKFHSSVVERVENSYFDPAVIGECREKAEKNGYQLTVETYGEMGNMDARIILDFVYVFPVIQMSRRYTIEGYAR